MSRLPFNHLFWPKVIQCTGYPMRTTSLRNVYKGEGHIFSGGKIFRIGPCTGKKPTSHGSEAHSRAQMSVMRLSKTILAIALAWSCLAFANSYSVPQTDCIGQACNPGLGIKACCPNALCGLKEFPDGLETHVSCKIALEYGWMRLLTDSSRKVCISP